MRRRHILIAAAIGLLLGSLSLTVVPERDGAAATTEHRPGFAGCSGIDDGVDDPGPAGADADGPAPTTSTTAPPRRPPARPSAADAGTEPDPDPPALPLDPPVPEEVPLPAPGAVDLPPEAAEGSAHAPAFAPSGAHLAFVVDAPGGDAHLWLAAAAQGWRGAPVPGVAGHVRAAVPDWSAAGLVLYELRAGAGPTRIYAARPGQAGTAVVPLSQLRGDIASPSSGPGGAFAFIHEGDLWRGSFAEATPRRLTASAGTEVSPAWGPTLAVERSGDLIAVDPDTRREQVLVDRPTRQIRPRWAQDTLVWFASTSSGWELHADADTPRVLARGVRLPQRSGPATSDDGAWAAAAFTDTTRGNVVTVRSVDGQDAVDFTSSDLHALGEPALSSATGRLLLAFTALPAADATHRALYVVDVTDQLP